MLKKIPERVTYAQEKLVKLIEERKLRKWCHDNGFNHATVYCLAVGDRLATYKTVCSMSHLIAPIEWIYYTDEKIPYDSELVPPLPANSLSKFVLEHKFDYKTICKKYDIPELTGYNIFVAYRSKPSLMFIRKVAADINPIDFFITGDIKSEEKYIPDRGDIVSISTELYLVLTSSKKNRSEKAFVCCKINSEDSSGLKIKSDFISGYANPSLIISFSLSSNPTLIDRISTDLSDFLRKIKSFFD